MERNHHIPQDAEHLSRPGRNPSVGAQAIPDAPMPRANRSQRSAKAPEYRSAGGLLDDGRLYELVYDPRLRRTAFAVGHGESIAIVPSIGSANGKPTDASNALRRAQENSADDDIDSSRDPKGNGEHAEHSGAVDQTGAIAAGQTTGSSWGGAADSSQPAEFKATRACNPASGSSERIVPFSATNNLIRHQAVLLPSGPSEYGGEAELTAAIRAFICRYVALTDAFVEIAVHYVMLSWVYDAFNELPYLRLRGDYGTGKTRALMILGSIAYKPFFASGASTVSPIFHTLDAFNGTLVFDEADFRMSDEKAELVKILNNGTVRGMPVLRTVVNDRNEFNPAAFQVFGPKIVATRGIYDDRALESRFITEIMTPRPLSRDIPINLPDIWKDEALELRNKLLTYRFRRRRSVRLDPGLVDIRLEPRLNQVLVPLLSIVEDKATRAEIASRAASLQASIVSERGLSIEADILDALADLIADTSRNAVPIKAIAERVAAEHGADHRRPITPRFVGSMLRRRLNLLLYKSNGVYVVPSTEWPKVKRIASRNITVDHLIAAAQRIFRPYSLDVREVVWWSVYDIGQRLTDRFDDVPAADCGTRQPRIFIAGDACHTHSPKAGQGMNVSMGDAFNLGWKLAAVLEGRSPEELLASYSAERQTVARDLIEFDKEWAKIMSARPKEGTDHSGEAPRFQRYFIEHGRYTAGMSVRYAQSKLTGPDTWQRLATGFGIGTRFHSAPVVRVGDGKPMHIGHTVKADGRWRVYAFSDSAPARQDSAIGKLCTFLAADPSSPIRKYTSAGADVDAVIDFRAVYQQGLHELEVSRLPQLLLPKKGRLGLADYEKAYCVDPRRDIYDLRGIDRAAGCVVIVRPDQYVAHVLPLDAHRELAAFFDGFMLPAPGLPVEGWAPDYAREPGHARALAREIPPGGPPAAR